MNRQIEGGWQNNFEKQRMFPKYIYMHSIEKRIQHSQLIYPGYLQDKNTHTILRKNIYIQHIKYKNIMQTFC